MLGGLAAGFLGAGLLGMLFGGGMFGGLGGLSSIFGLILQIGLILSWCGWQCRGGSAATRPAYADAGAGAERSRRAGELPHRDPALAWARAARRLKFVPADYEAFERLLGEIQAAWSNEDVAKLHTLATPEMVSYFTAGPRRPTRRATSSTRSPASSCCRATLRKPGVKAKPITPAWRCGSRWSTRRSIAPAAGWSKAASSRSEATEVWTFLRPRGGNWELSAIQQT